MLREVQRAVNMHHPCQSRLHSGHSTNNHHSQLRSTGYLDCCFMAYFMVKTAWTQNCDKTLEQHVWADTEWTKRNKLRTALILRVLKSCWGRRLGRAIQIQRTVTISDCTTRLWSPSVCTSLGASEQRSLDPSHRSILALSFSCDLFVNCFSNIYRGRSIANLEARDEAKKQKTQKKQNGQIKHTGIRLGSRIPFGNVCTTIIVPQWSDQRLRNNKSWSSKLSRRSNQRRVGTLYGYLERSSSNESQSEISCTKGCISSRSTRILQTVCWDKTFGVQIFVWQRGLWSHRHEEGQADKFSVTGRWLLTVTTDKQGNSFPSRIVLSCELWSCVSIPTRSRSSFCHCCKVKETCMMHERCPPDSGGTSLTKHCVVVTWFPRELIDVFMCCGLHIRVSEPGLQRTLHTATMLHLRKCWTPFKEVQLQANPWQESSFFL